MINCKYQIKFKSQDGHQYVSSIYEEDYFGDIIELKGAADPFVTEEEDDKDAFYPVRTSTGFVNIIDERGDLIEELSSISATSHYIDLMRKDDDGDVLVWHGFLSEESYSQVWCDGIQILNIAIKSPLEVLKSLKISQSFFISKYNLRDVFEFVVFRDINKYSPRKVFRSIYFPCIQIAQFGWYSTFIYIANFFTKEEKNTPSGKAYVTTSISLYDLIVAYCSFFGWSCSERADELYFNYFSALDDEWGQTYGDKYYIVEYSDRGAMQHDGNISRKDISELTFSGNNHKTGFIRGCNSVSIEAFINKIDDNIFNGIELPDLVVDNVFYTTESLYSSLNTLLNRDSFSSFYNMDLAIHYENKIETSADINTYKNHVLCSPHNSNGNFTSREYFYHLTNDVVRWNSGHHTQYEPSEEETNIPLGSYIFRDFSAYIPDQAIAATQFVPLLPTWGIQPTQYDYIVEMGAVKRRTGALFCLIDTWKFDEAHTSYNYNNSIYCAMMPQAFGNGNSNAILTIRTKDEFVAGDGYFNLNISALFTSVWRYQSKPFDNNGYIVMSIKHGNKYWSGYSWGTSLSLLSVYFDTDGNLKTNRTADMPVEGSGGLYIPAERDNAGIVQIVIYDELGVTIKAQTTAEINHRDKHDVLQNLYAWDMIIRDFSFIFLSQKDITADGSDTNTYTELINLNTDREKIIETTIATYIKDLNVDGYGFLRKEDGTRVQEYIIPSWNGQYYDNKSIRPEIHLLQRMKQYYDCSRQWIKASVLPIDVATSSLRIIYKSKEFACIAEKRNWQENKTEITLTEIPKSYED